MFQKVWPKVRDHLHLQPAWARRLEQKMDKLMATLTDIQTKQAATDAAVAVIKTDVETLLAKIAAFPAPGLTPDQQAAIDDIAAHADKINTALGAVDAEVNPPTPPVTPPTAS